MFVEGYLSSHLGRFLIMVKGEPFFLPPEIFPIVDFNKEFGDNTLQAEV